VGYVVAAVLGYLLGSIPVALLVARRHGVDLRATGDGNPGAWNALEQLGPRAALPVFAGDAGKAFVAALAGRALEGWWGGYAGVAGAMVGHAFPLFAGFRGGKSVMCFVGGGIALSPLAAAVCVLLCGAVTVARSFAWGARAGVFAFPLVQLATDPVGHVIGTGVLMGLIGLLFVLQPRMSGRARSGPGAAPTA
jgi:acyl phosphate:glycerol-3-phosphate acyltransferase